MVVVLGNHEAMNLLGDFRYTTAGEFAAFAGPDSAALRDRVYDQNRATIEAAAHASNPALTPQQIREGWMAQHPLGWLEHQLAWSPSGELGRWASRNPAVVMIGGTLFVHGGISAEYARLPLQEINRRVAKAMAAADDRPTSILNDPLGPLWYRGLVARDADAEAARAAAKTRRGDAGAGARCRPLRLWRQTNGHRSHARPQGHRDPRRRPPGAHRYRQFPLLWRSAHMARDRRCHHDPAHSRTVNPMKCALLALFAAFLLPFSAPAAAQAPKPLFAASDPIHITHPGAAPGAHPQPRPTSVPAR